MYETVDVSTALDLIDPSRPAVVVAESSDYPGCLEYLVPDVDRQPFYAMYSDWVSRHLQLSELFQLSAFTDRLREDGWRVLFDHSTKPILDSFVRWSRPLSIDGLTLTRPDGTPSALFDFQVFGLNKALERADDPDPEGRFCFFNWGAGSGKSVLSAAGSQELFNRDKIDLVLAFTLMKLKHNLRDNFERTTGLDAVVNDGTKAKRRKGYEQAHQVYVMNYEKLWHDEDELRTLMAGKRVLLVLDEAQKLLTDDKRTKARKSLEKLLGIPRAATVWPMTATAVGTGPLRYRDVFGLHGGRRTRHPLGTQNDFVARYARSVNTKVFRTRSGTTFSTTMYEWDKSALHDVRHRIADRVHSVRKTDPGVAHNFKGSQTVVVPVQLSDSDLVLYRAVIDRAREAQEREESLAPYYRLLRLVCSNPESLRHSQSEVAAELVAEYADHVTAHNSAKVELLLDQIESLRDAGDKIVLFTEWTTLGIHLLAPHLDRRGISYVKHWGVGQSAVESHAAVQRFKADPDITVFLSSDAGSHGLSFQEARYVIQYEPTYSADLFVQRSERINRADSYLDGLTNYVYVTDNSVEQRIWAICNERKEVSAAVQGTNERFSTRGEEPTRPNELAWIIFGEEE